MAKPRLRTTATAARGDSYRSFTSLCSEVSDSAISLSTIYRKPASRPLIRPSYRYRRNTASQYSVSAQLLESCSSPLLIHSVQTHRPVFSCGDVKRTSYTSPTRITEIHSALSRKSLNLPTAKPPRLLRRPLFRASQYPSNSHRKRPNTAVCSVRRTEESDPWADVSAWA